MKTSFFMEIWKKIEGYEGYEVSNEGRVRGDKGVLKKEKTRCGYLRVTLYKDGKQKHFQIHRLVAAAFCSNPEYLPCVNHKNEDKTDNRVENLEWCSHKYNINYGTCIERRAKLQTNRNTSKPVLQFTLDGVFIREWPSLKEVNRVLGYATTNISKCCLGKSKMAYGYIWRHK